MADSPVPLLLAASGVAAEFCAQPEIWPLFREFLYEGMEKGIEPISPEVMQISASVMLLIVQGVEREMIAAKFAEMLSGN